MADEDDRRGGEEGGGPGDRYQPFVVMEELLDKLKLLHYEESFCKQLGFKPFSRYFCQAKCYQHPGFSKFSMVIFLFHNIVTN